MTVETARFYQVILILALAGAAFAIFQTPILKPPDHPLTLRIIRWELFIFVAVIILPLICRTITITTRTAVAGTCFGSSTFRIDEIKGYVEMAGNSTPAWYILNRENKILWSFSKPAGMRVFEEEEELMRWIESFDLLNAKGPSAAFRIKMSRLFLVGTFLMVSLPFQFVGLEIGLSMLSGK